MPNQHLVSVQHLTGVTWTEFKIYKLQNKIFLIRNTFGWVGRHFPLTVTIKGKEHTVSFEAFSRHNATMMYTPTANSIAEAKDHFVILFYDNAFMKATSYAAQIPTQTLTVTNPGTNYTPGEQAVFDLVEDKLTRKRGT